MKFPINLCPFTPDEEKDSQRAIQYAALALCAEYAPDAKFFHGLARFYWARANS